MAYIGDQTERLKPGTRLGPTFEGVMLEVTEAIYDRVTDRTSVRTRALELADGTTLRFVGGEDA